MSSLFITSPHTALAVQPEQISGVTLLACLVTFMAVYTGTAVGERLSSTRLYQRRRWWPGGALVIALGAWNMCFTGVLTSAWPFAVEYHPQLVLASLLPAVAAGLIYQYSMARPGKSILWRSLAGLAFGLAALVMHYLGQFSVLIEAPAELAIVTGEAGLAMGVALVLGMGTIHGLHYTRFLPTIGGIRSRSLIMGSVAAIALCIIHVTAASSVRVLADAPLGTPPANEISSLLSVLLSTTTAIFAAGMLSSVLFDRYQLNSIQRDQASRTQLFDIIESMHDGVALLDHKARLVMCNHAFEALIGVRHSDLLGLSMLSLSRVLRFGLHRSEVLRSLREHNAWLGDVEVRHRLGHRFPAHLSINRVRAHGTAAEHFVATLTDTSAQYDAQRQIHHQAYHDALTGLPNRRALKERIHALQEASNDNQHHVMLMLVDIDSFKTINDRYGQAMGDRLLKAVSDRLRSWARESADLARLSSNEFALLYGGLSSEPAKAEAVALDKTTRLLEALNGDYALAGQRLSCRISAGYLLYCGRDLGVDELLKRAGLALLESKCEGDQRPRAFESRMVDRLNARLRMERQLHDAIHGEQLRLHIQPQVDARRRMMGGEALVRWQHPERGIIAPNAFIRLAEETGQIIEIGHWMLNQVCSLLADWQHHPQRRNWHLSLNVSVREFQHLGFVERVEQVLTDSGAPAGQLTLELTESLMLEDSWPVIDTLSRLRKLGVRLAIDDFGTGYSSLAYLKRLPLDVLKIDVTFVHDLTEDPQAAPIAQTIIALAQTLQLDVIAEGVETLPQQQRLIELGCSQFQGFFYAPALPLGRFLAFAESADQQACENPLSQP
ncbi:putative bifunctional diguanylate cyclase/phosphodiesterase [Halomonas cupida]|uniref:putative bifunctional diguanylate cyclase/phosphodiesterase n=1 Tax=Halomonas cupida TaxID=44933 RepID=UPI003A921273